MCHNIILSTFRFWTELQCYDDRITEKGFFSSFWIRNTYQLKGNRFATTVTENDETRVKHLQENFEDGSTKLSDVAFNVIVLVYQYYSNIAIAMTNSTLILKFSCNYVFKEIFPKYIIYEYLPNVGYPQTYQLQFDPRTVCRLE